MTYYKFLLDWKLIEYLLTCRTQILLFSILTTTVQILSLAD